MTPAPPLTALTDLDAGMADAGFAVLEAASVAALAGVPPLAASSAGSSRRTRSDERVVHESTPIQPQDAAQPAHRDTLVLTFRQRGFQGPNQEQAT